MDFYIAHNEDIPCEYNAQGVSRTELLPGTHDDSIRAYKFFVKAGCQVSPETYASHQVLCMFGKGTGYVQDGKDAYAIEELSFYAPDFDRCPYTVHAITDMEFVMVVIAMSEGDWEDYAASHARLPFFRPLSRCVKYDQDCKGPNTTSWHVFNPKQFGHVICGVVRAEGEGTVEKGHPAVHQWNYCVGDSDFEMTVNGQTVNHKAGEWSFIPAGPDHSLVAKPGKEVFYVWFEQFTRGDRNYFYKPLPKQTLPAPGKDKLYVARNADLPHDYDAQGSAMCELLPGSYEGGIRNYKYWVKAGASVELPLRHDELVLVMVGKGKGYIASDKHLFKVEELSFYAPNFDAEPYTIHATEDMELVYSVISCNEHDRALFMAGHVRLPFFLKYSDGTVYDQDCKGPNTTSWMILGPRQLGRIMVGVVRAVGEGTVEKGHVRVEQWNYCVGDSDFEITVDGEAPARHVSGDWSYVPAGYDHSLVAPPGKEVFYVWYEHYTREKDFAVAIPAQGDPSVYD